MAVPPQLTQIAFAGGFDESQRPEVLDPSAAFTTIENCRQDYRGGFTRRLGFSSLVSTRIDATTRSAGHRLTALGSSIITIDGSLLDVYSPTNATWSQRGRVPPCSVKRRRLASVSGTAYETYDIAYASGYLILVYREDLSATTFSVNAVIVDATSYSVVHAAQLSSTTDSIDNVRVVAVGTDIVAVWNQGTTIKGARLSISAINTGWATAVSLATDLKATAKYLDVCALTTRIAIAYCNDAVGVTRQTVATHNSTVNALTQLQTAQRTTAGNDITAISIDGAESDVLWIAWTQATAADLYVRGVNPTTISSETVSAATVATLASTGALRVAIGYAGSTTAWVAGAAVNSTVITWADSKTVKVYNNAGTAASVAGTAISLWGWLPASRPFVQDSRAYLECYYHDDTVRTAVLVDITSATTMARPIAWVAPRLHEYTPDGELTTRHTVAVSASKRVGVAAIRSSAVTSSIVAVEYDFASSTRWLPQTYADSLFFTGGMTYVFDGQRVAEHGFVVAPRVYLTEVGTGLTGTFNYTAIYEFSDSNGNVIWSATAPVQTVSPSNKTIRVYVRTLSVTWKDGTDAAPLEPRDLRRIRIKLYRTTNGTSGPFYLVTTFVNDPSVAHQTVDDATADATLSTRAQLYTSPGVNGEALDREALPALSHMTECNGALVGIADDGVTLYATAQRVIGEQPWTNDEFAQPIEGEGDIIAVAALDGTLFAFKRRAIYALSVEAPSDNHSSGGFGAPRRLAADVGCNDPRSLVVTSLGVFFQGDDGQIWLLNRGQSVEPIGAAVQTTTASYPIVSAATLDTENSLVRFSLAASEASGLVSGNGVDIVYDLTLKAWISRDTHASNTPAQASAMVLVGSAWRYAWLSAAGVVYYEKLSSDATAYLDATSTWITMLVETAWFKPSGIQGKQHVNRVLFLAKRATAHGLAMSLAYDYSTTYKSPRSWTESEITTLAAALPNEQVVHNSHDEAPCQAVRIKIQDSTPATVGTGQGATWIGLTVDSTPMQGAYELPDTAA